MEAVDASKVAQVHAESPLEDAGILKQVLSYAGAGEWIFYAPISKLWLECYRAVPVHQLDEKDTVEQEHDFEVVPQLTLKRAVFALLVSNWRMSLACNLTANKKANTSSTLAGLRVFLCSLRRTDWACLSQRTY